MDPMTRSRSGPAWCPIFSSSMRSPLNSSSHGPLFSQKNDVAKRLGLFDIRKVHQSQKQGNLLRSVKTK
jgi:hypothetical protein